jgi:hypothetical protein
MRFSPSDSKSIMRAFTNKPSEWSATIFAALLALFAGAVASAQPLTLHVATNGNDAWSGRLAEPRAGGSDGPLRTPASALRAARMARLATPAPESVTILFRAGRHELAEPLPLTDEDSGANAQRAFTLVYWDTRPGAAEKLKFGGATWDAWRARGHDVNSVIADPLFVDAAKFDLRLQAGSPALKLGFRPIDMTAVGVREKRGTSAGR